MSSDSDVLPTLDRHVRRSGDDYARAFIELLPHGQAWPRHPESTLVMTCTGLAGYWGFVDGRAADLLERESDPRYAIELLPDWERAWGLPDPCLPSATTIGERQRMLIMVMTWMGGQSRAYFTKVMQWLGYPATSIDIKEFAPFMAGISRAGDTRPTPADNFRWYIGPPEQRFSWSVEVGTVGLVWFRAGVGQAGVDHHLEFRVPAEMLCLINRWKPAHTDLIYDFSKLAFASAMEGTP
jgi:uncharacterized protein YmfQ (DUF2313 family)